MSSGKIGTVCKHLFVVAERLKNRGEQRGRRWIGGRADAVVHPFAFASGGNDASLAQVREVARDLGLALAENLDKIADTDLAASHQVEQAQTSGVSQGGKESRQRKRFGATRH